MNGARGRILAAIGASMLASVGLTIVYALGGDPQIEGVLLGVSLGGIAIGLVLFGHHLLPGDQFVEPRDVIPHATAERPGVEAAFEAGAEPIERRRAIAIAFVASLGLLGIAALFPIRSLGTRPGRTLFRTQWRRGRRAVTDSGRPIQVSDLDLNSVVTVFPEGHENAADSQTLLIRLPDDVPPPGPSNWSVSGVVAFSKICTHAGCPVGLYQAETQELFCPCHQSTFSVPEGAKPTFGPATRPLPQLPIGVDEAGFIVSLSDYTEPVGPGFWNRPE
ncbi:MAG TPA: Rieske 2Fe-2S domain-containing protein [Acidimicrobiales bacterium]|nr:Rieske 2Fe-2S domain-containing protein [Acidimicrobiales bacterium]